ncbi:bifunctional glycosyltransferase family 2 protein/CDP-glycerol:glycerophosphate glycerophosphotransferase [Streptomyces sp. NBC_00654]|uniref:bifunctional glycosyltransferase/CDP-glycerol:glycerophosphate glycerophosphotransferase n=1 Tax=Streptomyces sp. NBC_00654 TaxID=2975799 RepID=UPI00224D908E|nr:bifunctional glycosyltransferase family 2 protein/CDP-glycerol:glycerophosphate glycerophosphotransferase [Streptomyces sp. NBC_00654]MCX4969713.1 bifunctional glycosyltransferase family 2 protein/CDP-glycerol:glycerophosphate glycerophosphotransferase [Streptomyces sp. NBC_00654]
MLLSVVVAVHRSQGYLRAALDSVCGQVVAGAGAGAGPCAWELIVVDDGSADGGAAIAAEYARRDPRVRVLAPPDGPRGDGHPATGAGTASASATGTGAARNAGAAVARGRYLLFLDPEDLLLPGALGAMAERLDAQRPDGEGPDGQRSDADGPDGEGPDAQRPDGEGADAQRSDADGPDTGGPDVLCLGHDRVDWWGDVRPPDEAPAPGAQLFRRAFWTAHRLRFPDGPYEDVLPVHRARLLAAGSGTLDRLDRLCVRHRLRRAGTFATTPGRAHFAVIDAYARLLAETGEDPRVHPLRTAHLLAVLADPGRIRPGDRAAFFRAAGLPGGYAAHRARQAARTGRARTREASVRSRKALRTRVMGAAYRADLHRPLDPDLAVYGAYWNRGVACNPAAIHAEARELVPHIRGLWVVSSRYRDRVPPGIEYVIEGSRAYWRAMATATYLINNSSFPGGFTKRPGQRYLQTHHGTPLKTMGLDQRSYPALTNGISFEKILAHADQWDFSLSANPHTTEIWDRVYPSSYEHLDLGHPRNDIFFTATRDRIAKLRAGLGIAPGQTALLYAPTHRDYRRGFVPRLDLDRFTRELGPQYVVLVRAHYFYGRSAGLEGSGRAIDVTGHPSVEELCLAADALITDYSSLMFDYACLDRPLICYAPDWDAYRASRGTYFDLLSGLPGDTPGAVAATQDELLEVVRSGEWCSPRTAALRTAFRERFCPYDDGHAAERVVRRFFGTG